MTKFMKIDSCPSCALLSWITLGFLDQLLEFESVIRPLIPGSGSALQEWVKNCKGNIFYSLAGPSGFMLPLPFQRIMPQNIVYSECLEPHHSVFWACFMFYKCAVYTGMFYNSSTPLSGRQILWLQRFLDMGCSVIFQNGDSSIF